MKKRIKAKNLFKIVATTAALLSFPLGNVHAMNHMEKNSFIPYSTMHVSQNFGSNIPVEPTKTWTITFNTPVNPDSVNENTIYVLDSTNNKVNVTFEKKQGSNVVEVKAPETKYTPGATYYLHITTEVESSKGKKLKEPVVMPFTILSNDRITINSTWASTPPSIDGNITSSEWGAPVFSKNLTYKNALTGEQESHEMTGYIKNDGEFLYIGVKVAGDNFESEHSTMDGNVDVMEVYFDNNNDEQITAGEYTKNFWNLDFGNWVFKGDGTWSSQGVKDSIGKATHSNQATGDYHYEFKMPLSSISNDKLGIKFNFREMHPENGKLTWVGPDGSRAEDMWPELGSRYDTSTYAILQLAKN
jgi:hypothetical protein